MAEVKGKSFYRSAVYVVVAGTSTAAAAYLAYRFYFKNDIDRRLRNVRDAARKMHNILTALSEASELSTFVLDDLKEFLESDADEAPRSIRQLMKLSNTGQFQLAIQRTVASVALGIAQGTSKNSQGACRRIDCNGSRSGEGLAERIVGKFFSREGTAFASEIISRTMQTIVTTFLDSEGKAQSSSTEWTEELNTGHQLKSQPPSPPWQVLALNLLASPKGRRLVEDCIKSFTINAVGTYLEKTKDGNMYDDILAGISRHHALVKDVSSHVITTTVREAIPTFFTSRNEFRGREVDQTSEGSSSSLGSSPRAGFSCPLLRSDLKPGGDRTVQDNNQWTMVASSLLSEPKIRNLILDVTSVVTSRGIETFLLVVFCKLFGTPNFGDPFTRFKIVVEGAEGQGLQMVRSEPLLSAYSATKTSRILAGRALAVASMCLAVMLHYMSLS